MSLKAISGMMQWYEMPEMLGILMKTAYQAIVEKTDPFITFNPGDEGVIVTYDSKRCSSDGFLTLNIGVNAARSCVFTEHGIMTDIRLDGVAQEAFIPYTSVKCISSRGNPPHAFFGTTHLVAQTPKEKSDVPTTKPTLTVVKQ